MDATRWGQGRTLLADRKSALPRLRAQFRYSRARYTVPDDTMVPHERAKFDSSRQSGYLHAICVRFDVSTAPKFRLEVLFDEKVNK